MQGCGKVRPDYKLCTCRGCADAGKMTFDAA
jgi:hypothetical protein